jgi:uncharacterized hydrophobic protein (TIGR00271 family)
MLELRIYGHARTLETVGRGLDAGGAVRGVAITEAVRAGQAVLTAEVSPGAADRVLAAVADRGVPDRDVALVRLDDVGPIHRGPSGASLIWADVLSHATVNARPVARYLTFMVAAGVIAAFGVIEVNTILIVGAMAVSPDLLPVTAACAAAVARRWSLAGKALLTLVVGLGAACVSGALLTVGLRAISELPPGFEVGEAALAGLTTVNTSTCGVALAAGIAGMLAVETRASAAVGVGISITTIPAAAYLGVAAGEGEVAKVLGALAVLAVNIAMLLVGGISTLLLQRRLSRVRDRAGAASQAAGRAGDAARTGRAAVRSRR